MIIPVIHSSKTGSGFTLVEISIVLVIIGLIVGGVLVGRDLIRASELRGMVSEMEEFKTAANTFKLKYGQLPGDMHISVTAQLGFFTFTDVTAGTVFGNNDGIYGDIELGCAYEGSVFFYHLAQANLVKMSSSTPLRILTIAGSWAGTPLAETWSTPYTLSSYLPESKIGGAYWCAGNIGYSYLFSLIPSMQKTQNAFSLRGATKASRSSQMEPAVSPIDLYSTDKKIDDGLPLKGKLLNTTYDDFTGTYPYWGAAASSSVCAFGGANATDVAQTYNASVSTGANSITCQPVFVW